VVHDVEQDDMIVLLSLRAYYRRIPGELHVFSQMPKEFKEPAPTWKGKGTATPQAVKDVLALLQQGNRDASFEDPDDKNFGPVTKFWDSDHDFPRQKVSDVVKCNYDCGCTNDRDRQNWKASDCMEIGYITGGKPNTCQAYCSYRWRSSYS
jgi:hypothetical protein